MSRRASRCGRNPSPPRTTTCVSPSSASRRDSPTQALRRAEEGLWVFEDQRSDEPAAGLRRRTPDRGRACPGGARHPAGRVRSAHPSQDLYHRLGAIGGEPAKAWALGFLEAALSFDRTPRVGTRQRTCPSRSSWRRGRVRARVGDQPHRWGTSSAVKAALARTSEDTHPADAAFAPMASASRASSPRAETPPTEWRPILCNGKNDSCRKPSMRCTSFG